MTYEVHWQEHCQNPPVSRALVGFLAMLLLVQIRADQQPGSGYSGWDGSRGLRNLARIAAYMRDRAWLPHPEEKIFLAAAHAMAAAAGDPYTQILTPEMAHLAQDLLEDRLRGGIGVEVGPCRGRGLRVLRVAPYSPAAEGGLLADDLIVAIDGCNLASLSFIDMLSRLRGDVGTTVRLEVERDGRMREVALSRQPLAPTLYEGRMLNGGIAYLLMRHFAEGAAAGARREIQRLQAQGLQALILDLRWNPGGSLEEALAVAELFLPAGALVVHEEYRTTTKNARRERRASGEAEAFAFPLVILVDKESASAAELLAAALQEHRRAVLVGQRTFGKARIQEIVPLDGGSALRLTVGRYLTPGGRDIEGEGLQPDVAILLPEDKYWEICRRWADYSQGRGQAPLAIDPQASRAVEELRHLCRCPQPALEP